MYTIRYKLKIAENGKESSRLLAKFRFGKEIPLEDREKVRNRIINFCRGKTGSYLMIRGFNRKLNGIGFEKITEEYSLRLYPRRTLIRNGLNIEANSFGKNLSLDKMINLDEINNFILTGKS